MPHHPAPNSATGKPLHAGFWLGKNLSDCFRFGGRGLGQEASEQGPWRQGAWAIRVKDHWAIWIRSGLLSQVWCLDARFWSPKRTHFSKLCLMGWSWEAWGWVSVWFGQVLTRVLHVLAKGFPRFCLEWTSYEGRCWTKKFKIWPGPNNPKNVPRRSQEAPGPSQNL